MEEDKKDFDALRTLFLARRARRDTVTGLITQMHRENNEEANKRVSAAKAEESKILKTISKSQRKPTYAW